MNDHGAREFQGSGKRALGLDEIVAKFRANAALLPTESRIEAILDTLLNARTATPVREITPGLA